MDEEKFKDIISKIKMPTKEEIEEMSKREYERNKKNKNNYSYWYEKVKDCGIDIAKSYIYKIPYDQYKNLINDSESGRNLFEKYVKEEIKTLPNTIYNIKNGTFSNKFDFKTCISSKEELPDKLYKINYQSALFEAGGYTEFIIRELINYDYKNIPTIYNGMPLRTEIRVFYNFDTRKVLYSVNYWNFDYCYKNIYDITDKIVFVHEKERLENEFIKRKEEVEKLVEKHMQGVDLSGNWSIDILYDELNDKYYLIDMAIAEQSAYWRK